MSNVVELFPAEDEGPHMSGTMKCLGCKHEWVGVAPVGTSGMECPECGCGKGVWWGLVLPPEEEQVWTCNSCEGQVFMITQRATVCVGCGSEFKD